MIVLANDVKTVKYQNYKEWFLPVFEVSLSQGEQDMKFRLELPRQSSDSPDYT